ncbi:MAG: aspartate/glutamate racemase family protein, partial [Eggerthellaceae bacterium]|nr:aspartate/glutamate racemase family protein [Eggerthellaceae bacterium]
TIGVVGGMGAYASHRFYSMLIDAFPADVEQDAPRIVIDNRCSIPPRRQGLIDDASRYRIVAALTESVSFLLETGASCVVVCCNAAHSYLDEVLELIPDAKPFIVDIIEELADQLSRNNVNGVFVLASEASSMSKIHAKALEMRGIDVTYPNGEEQKRIDALIYGVKRGVVPSHARHALDEIVASSPAAYSDVVAGCTELPIIYDRQPTLRYRIWDPLVAAIEAIRKRKVAGSGM